MTQRNDITRHTIRTTEKRSLRDVAINQGQVLLDSDHNEQGHLILSRVEEGTSDILGSPERLVVQAGSDAFKLTGGVDQGDCMVGKGHGWLDGWRVGNPDTIRLSEQPHPLVEPDFEQQGVIGLKALVRYLDPVEEPALADKALGDAQASGRTLIDWQLFPVPLSPADSANCTKALSSADWQAISEPSTGTLAFLVETSTGNTDPCSLTPEGGYSRLENLLYRIEVHDGTPIGGAPGADGPRFGLEGLKVKLSRRNASVLARVTNVSGTEITVTPPARDPRVWLAPGQYAEIVSLHDDVDPTSALAAERLFRVASTSDDRVVLEATVAQLAATKIAADGTWFLRLWEAYPDGSGIQEVTHDAGGLSKKIDLGDGLAIQLGGVTGSFRRGDYWCCAARADESIDWPENGGVFEQQTPHGPEVRYAVVGLYDDTGPNMDVSDCRVPFAPLTDQIQVIGLGGDGQEVTADSKNFTPVELPFKLRVGVVRGSEPVEGQQVRFSITGGSGTLDGAGNIATITTDSVGVAEVSWALDSNNPAQRVEAVRLDGFGDPTHSPVHFNGFLSRADQTSYDPSNTPELAGAHDVQTAIELLAGQQQLGCSTYVIQEGSDWVATLEAIKDGEDAAICFQRGTFETGRTVTLSKKGHLKISGAGPGTRIIVKDAEAALDFEACSSVELSHLHISAPESNSVLGQIKHRRGAVTISSCTDVTIKDCILECGPGASAQRCCLRIAGEALKGNQAAVMNCLFRTGYLQDALIISDCDDIKVRDNAFETVKRPDKLDISKLLADHRWAHVAASALIKDLQSIKPQSSGAGPHIRGKKYSVHIKSTVPQEEWDELVKSDPPTARDNRSKADFKRYVARIMSRAVEQPALLPSYEANLERVTSSLGTSGRRGLHEAIRRNMLANTIDEAVALAPPGQPESKLLDLQVKDIAVRFESPVSQQDWSKALKASGEVPKITDFESFRRSLWRIGRKIVSDKNFIANLRSAQNWRKDYLAGITSLSRDAVCCVGKALGKVSISGNRVLDFQLGIRVATSHGKWTKLYTKGRLQETDFTRLLSRSVDIYDNQLRLRTQGPRSYVPFGMFVGHAETVRIHGNEMHYADLRADIGDDYYLEYGDGIRLFGHYGRLISIKDNHISVAVPAIRLKLEKVQNIPGSTIPSNWVIADNMGYPFDDRGAVQLQVPNSHPVVQRNNIPS